MHPNGTLLIRLALIAAPPDIYECAFHSNLSRSDKCFYPGEHVEILASILKAAKVSFSLEYVVSGRIVTELDASHRSKRRR